MGCGKVPATSHGLAPAQHSVCRYSPGTARAALQTHRHMTVHGAAGTWQGQGLALQKRLERGLGMEDNPPVAVPRQTQVQTTHQQTVAPTDEVLGGAGGALEGQEWSRPVGVGRRPASPNPCDRCPALRVGGAGMGGGVLQKGAADRGSPRSL